MNLWGNLGGPAAVGIGVGAALAASMGSIGYAFGLFGAFAAAIVVRAVKGRRA